MLHIILCGGVGSRLWPLSRLNLPKQFIRLAFESSPFEMTVSRNQALGAEICIVGNRENFFHALNQLKRLNIESFSYLIEPVGRNTASAITLGCLAFAKENDLILVTPSDHLIKDKDGYKKAISKGLELAKAGFLVTFGVKPTSPETGFGYIFVEGNKVTSFKEKPDLQTAKTYLNKTNVYWNAGIFCFRKDIFLAEIEQYEPKLLAKAKQALANAQKHNPPAIAEADMLEMPALSIDKALFEKSAKVACVPFPEDIGWSDLGNFDAIYNFYQDDLETVSKIKPILINSNNNLVLNSSRQVALIDIEDLIIVDSPDALLIVKRGSSYKLRELYSTIFQLNPKLVENFPRVEKSWGNYTMLTEEMSYRVIKIEMEPGQSLSAHRHAYREEQWIVVEGQAEVELGQDKRLLNEGDWLSVPPGSVHRLKNIGLTRLVIIEVQRGSLLADTDIERLSDEPIPHLS